VEKFPGHIACDGETKSEIVVPVIDPSGVVRAVIDIDCLDYNGFSSIDKEYLERLAKLIGETVDW
jgi:L-methionine (R)-S-oxide reductase